MKIKTNEISLAIVFSSLYTVLVVVLAPISYGPVQLRVADCLIPLAALFGWPAIAGVTVGCFLGNAYAWLGPQDVIFGAIANLIAAIIIFMLRKRPFLACVMGSLPVGVIVGGYLWLFFGFQSPDIFGLQLPVWGAMIVSITISTLIAVAGIGYAILKTLSRSSIASALKSRGLKIYIEE
ncbi:QueT transporter family protein [Candidatus Bathyarchaeota archaeon]|nr:QueT transporter family protein [Candidatus Bathyarchaeota archaeon]